MDRRRQDGNQMTSLSIFEGPSSLFRWPSVSGVIAPLIPVSCDKSDCMLDTFYQRVSLPGSLFIGSI